jgi:hypothetical protein
LSVVVDDIVDEIKRERNTAVNKPFVKMETDRSLSAFPPPGLGLARGVFVVGCG